MNARKEIKVLAQYTIFGKTLKQLLTKIKDKDIQYVIIDNIKRKTVKVLTDNDKEDLQKIYALADDYVKQIQTLKKKNDSLVKVLNSYDDMFRQDVIELH